MIEDAGWGWGPAFDGKTLFAGPAGACDWLGCERPHVPGDGGAVWGECGQRCEVVAALARIAEKPDLTLRAVVAELAERGTPASYGAVWRFFKHEGISFKKKACTPVNRTAPTSPVGGPSGRNTRAGLTPSVWCSSTKLGLRPI